MDKLNITNALQDLIIRLQDSEEGYKMISFSTSHMIMKKWMEKYSKERHNMHVDLELYMMSLGGLPEVKTSFLGELHQMFIDIKLNSFFDNIPSIVTEVERGASVLLSEYDNVMENITMPNTLLTLLKDQKATIENELKQLVSLKEQVEA